MKKQLPALLKSVRVTYNGQPVFFNLMELAQYDLAFFNATPVAKQFGRNVREYTRLKQTTEYRKALEDFLAVGNSHVSLVFTRTNGPDRGTWLANKLAIDFARWLNPKFAVWLDQQIFALLKQERSRKRHRNSARIEHHGLSRALLMNYSKTHDGANPQPHVFVNEANLINRIVLGMSSKQFKESRSLAPRASIRDHFSEHQMKAVDALQGFDKSLLEAGVEEYGHRKQLLINFFENNFKPIAVRA